MRQHSFDINHREFSPQFPNRANPSIYRNNSKNSLSAIGLPPKTKSYRSPSSTPTGSPMLTKLTDEDALTTISDAKESPAKDQVFYLRQKISIQEKRIHLLEEENRRLSSSKRSDFWEKELVKRNDEVRKLENQLKYFIEINGQPYEEKPSDNLYEKDRKIAVLEQQVSDSKLQIETLEACLSQLQSDNRKIQEKSSNLLKKEECEILMKQIQELELSLEYHVELNKELKAENEKLSKQSQTGSLAYFSQDIYKIKREMSKLTSLMKDFVQGKEITLKTLLGFEEAAKGDPLKQITQDLQSIKNDLNTVLDIISDIHAEQYSNVVCTNQ